MSAIKNVLLIDDDEISNMINTEVIRIFDQKIFVRRYVSALKALEELQLLTENSSDKLPDVVFLDINMPFMDGWEFLEHFSKLPLYIRNKCGIHILTSSIAPDDIKQSGTYSNVKSFISKPLTISHLRDIGRSGNNRGFPFAGSIYPQT